MVQVIPKGPLRNLVMAGAAKYILILVIRREYILNILLYAKVKPMSAFVKKSLYLALTPSNNPG